MNSELIIYQNPDGNIKIDVRLEEETVWLTQDQMAALFGKAKSTINEHINPHCASTRGNACIHKAIGLSEFLFVYYRFYFGEGSLLDAKGVKQLL